MVFIEALCAMNLAANAMVNGMCCFYEMKKESKRQEEQEKAIRNVFRTELDDLVLASNSSGTDESKSKNESSDNKNTSSDNNSNNNSNAKEHKAARSRDKLVRAYKDAFLSCSSKHQEEQQESSSSLPSTAPLQDDDKFGVPQYQDVYSPPKSLHIFERDQPPLQQQQQQQQQQSSQSYSYAPSSHRGNLFPIGIPARHQSFSRVTTKRFDNVYQLDSNNKDNVLDLFLYSSSSSCSSSTVSRHSQPKQQHPSLVNGYNLRNKRSPLLPPPPVRKGSSLLEEMSENNSEYDDHDWLDGSSRRSHHTESNNSNNNKDLRKELVWSNDVDSFESVRIE